MVGPHTTALKEIVETLADVCREKKILELELADVDCRDERGNTVAICTVKLKMSELALKLPPVSQSDASTPRPSDSPASKTATERKLRFGSGSP